MHSALSAEVAPAEPRESEQVSTPLTQKAFVRWVFLLLPAAVVLGPALSYPLYSGGLLTGYRILYVPAAVFCYIIWQRHGRPRFVGSRSLVVLTALMTIIGTIYMLQGSITPRGINDHIMLVTSMAMAWVIAAAVCCDYDVRNLLLTGWYAAYMLAAALAVLHAAGVFVVPTYTNVLIEAYASIGQQIGFAGTLGNPNDLAAFALAGGPIAYLAARRWSKPILAQAVFVAATAMGLVSLSRSAVVGVLVLPLVFVAYRRASTPGRLPALLIVSGYALALLFAIRASGLLAQFSGVPFLGRIALEVAEGGQVADTGRIYTWTEVIKISFANPWGIGPGQYEALAEDTGFALLLNVHNVFLEILIEYGVIVGLAGLVWMLIVIVNSWRLAREAATPWDNLVVALGATSLMGLTIWAVLTSSLITRPPWALLLGTAIGLISSVSLSKRDA